MSEPIFYLVNIFFRKIGFSFQWFHLILSVIAFYWFLRFLVRSNFSFLTIFCSGIFFYVFHIASHWRTGLALGLVCLLADRHVGSTGVGVEFFNQMAAFPKGPVALSLETQVPIVPAAFLEIDSNYKLIFGKPFIVPHFENDAQSIQHGLKVLSKELEKLILLDPNQWHSIQPVWTSEY